MGFIGVMLNVYFASVLGVTVLGKLEQPSTFAAVLRRNNILPSWGIDPVCRYFPWLELAVAGWLITGIAPVLASCTVNALFAGFLIVKVKMLLTRNTADCGCFGVAYAERVDKASIGTSVMFACLALAQLFLATQVSPVGLAWRIAVVTAFICGEGWLGYHTWQRYRENSRCQIWGPCTSPKDLTMPRRWTAAGHGLSTEKHRG